MSFISSLSGVRGSSLCCSAQAWSSMGNTRRVPRWISSGSPVSSSRSRASSEVLLGLVPEEAEWDPEAPLAVMAVSPYASVRSPSFSIRSESVPLSCSWFWGQRESEQWRDRVEQGAGMGQPAHTQSYEGHWGIRWKYCLVTVSFERAAICSFFSKASVRLTLL